MHKPTLHTYRDPLSPTHYSCPHPICAGLSLSSPTDCAAHDQAWHKEPYTCALCRRNYSSVFALCRHNRSPCTETSSPPPSPGTKFQCVEECCSRRGHTFTYAHVYNSHVNGRGHVNAVTVGELLDAYVALNGFGSAVGKRELARCKRAMRELRCDAEGCGFFRWRFKSAQGFWGHLGGRMHMDALRG